MPTIKKTKSISSFARFSILTSFVFQCSLIPINESSFFYSSICLSPTFSSSTTLPTKDNKMALPTRNESKRSGTHWGTRNGWYAVLFNAFLVNVQCVAGISSQVFSVVLPPSHMVGRLTHRCHIKTVLWNLFLTTHRVSSGDAMCKSGCS